jgi:hypothetical protein
MSTPRDTSEVEINLDQARTYRDPDNPSQVKSVGPGRVKVAKWLAEEWGITPIQGLLPEGAVSGTIETVEQVPPDEDEDETE